MGNSDDRLFDVHDRSDTTPRRYVEDTFSFLDRVQGPYWDVVRDLLERWFADYVEDAAPDKVRDLRARFRDPDPHQHDAAWWELYVHQLLRRLHPAADIRVEQDAGPRIARPDFLVSRGAEAFVVEVVRSFVWVKPEKARNPALEARALDAVNQVRSRDFAVRLEFLKVGTAAPKKRDVQGRLAEWLATLDPDEVLITYQAARPFTLPTLPIIHLKPKGWDILVEARPLDPGQRGTRERLIEIGPSEGGWVIDEKAIRDIIRKKSKRYEVNSRPLVIAAMPESATFGDETAANILYGSERVAADGETVRAGRTVFNERPRLSGLLFGGGIQLWTLARTWPRLWENPSAELGLFEWAFPGTPRVSLDGNGALENTAPDRTIASALGLPEDWPPGEAFPLGRA